MITAHEIRAYTSLGFGSVATTVRNDNAWQMVAGSEWLTGFIMW